MIRVLVLILSLSLSIWAENRTKVTFINPGFATEEYWAMVSSFMKAAAQGLDMDLEVLYSDRDHLKMVDLAREACDRSQKPDYLIVVNEKLVAPEMIEYAETKKIKTFLILNDFNDEQKKQFGRPRERNKHWLGTLVPDNVDAGYKIAEAILKQAKSKGWKNLKMVGIGGVAATPAASEREQGLQRALRENPEVKLLQLFGGNWEEKLTYEKAQQMFSRYPDVNLVWAANDLMASGAMKAAEERGKIPGKDILFGGLNWSQPGLEAVKNRRMVVTVGGHFMVGGWALVVLYDYEHGIDFRPFEMKADLFGTITSHNVNEYMTQLGRQNWEKIDFLKFTKKHNTAIKSYNFSLNKVLNTLKQ